MFALLSACLCIQERDDEMAAQTAVRADDDDDTARSSMKITLAPSETKPMTRHANTAA